MVRFTPAEKRSEVNACRVVSKKLFLNFQENTPAVEMLIPQGVTPSSTVPSQDPTVLLASGLGAGIGTVQALI